MRILADKEITYVYKLFGASNQLQMCEGRNITAKHLQNKDVLIIRSVTKIDSKLLYNSFVKFVGTTTSGIDHIDCNYLKKNNIKFACSSGSNAIAVVEYVLTSLFWLAQRDNFFLRDKTVGIIGVGNIGNLLYQRLHNFGVHTILYDPYVSRYKTNGNWKSFDELVSKSNILTFHTPLTYTGEYPTWHMVNSDVLDAISTHSILINTARGAVVDNFALLKILQNGKKINVVLDVWESEPYILSPLLDYIDIGTAHVAGYTVESKIRSVISVYNAFCDFFSILNKVDLSNLLSIKTNYIQIKNCDEILINQLTQSIYNIYQDHLALKNCSIRLGAFDLLRKYYSFRKEWSSIYMSTCKDYNDEILLNLGFSVF